MRALVLGATGHIGNAIVREMLNHGYHVTAVSRRKEPAANLVDLPVRFISGNSDACEQLDSWVAGQDVVVDAAAPYPLRLSGTASEAERRPAAYAAQRTQALLEVVHKHKTRLAYVSSFTTVVRRQKDGGGWQSRVARQLHPYFSIKDLIESQILAAAQRGLSAAIVNPTLCLGPWDIKPREICFVPRLLCGEIPVTVQHVLNIIDVRDVAVGLVAVLKAERFGEPILLSGHNITTDTLYAWLCEMGGVKPPRHSLPLSLGLFPAYGMEALLALAGLPSPLPSLAVMLGSAHAWVSLSTTQTALGATPRPLSATLLDTVGWYREIGYC